MEESKELKSLHASMQAMIYITIIVEILMFINFPFSSYIMPLLTKFGNLPIYNNVLHSKLFTFFFILVTCLGTRSKKNLDLKPVKHIIFPLLFGFILFFTSIVFLSLHDNNSLIWYSGYNITYVIFSFLGATFIATSLDNISKQIKSGFMKDQFNTDNESFEQSRKLVQTPFSVNIPMKFYWKKKTWDGWINIVNPFRGTLVGGTPGSGKSFVVINSFIKQHSAKGFALVVYDFKFPDLGKRAYYHFLINKKKGLIPQNFKFNVVNFSNIEYSKRINPLKVEYIETLSDATETAESLFESLQKGESKGGNADFFKTSAVNFLAASIYFWSRYKGGVYSDLPHVLSFINRSYDEIFTVLFSEPELISLISPFESAYKSGAVDQLEGQIGSLKIQLSRLATKESFWVFSGDDFNLKISDPNDPSYLVIANNPKTQSMNSALNALIINRLTRLVNTKNNLPTSIIVDESPTLYFHQLASLLSTARSNLVSVLLGIQEIPQLEEQYGKATSRTVISVIGNTLFGSARAKETLDWLQTLFGKVKQRKEGVSIQRERTTISLNEQMDYLIPASKIASLHAGSLVGNIALDYGQEEDFPCANYHCKANINIKEVQEEEKEYIALPKFYNFGTKEERERKLQNNFKRIYDEVDQVISELV